MNYIQRSSCVLFATFAIGLNIAAADEPAQDNSAIERAVRQAMPGTHIDAITPAPVPGLVEVVAGKNVLYTDTSGRWLVVGHLYDLASARDVTAERMAQLARIDWLTLPLEAAVHHGDGPLKLAVFSDPDCPWCRKLNQALRNAKGIEVWEIMFPVTALHPQARDKAVDILCDAQPAEALARAMDGNNLYGEKPASDCIARARQQIDRAAAFAKAHGIQGTPTLVAADGRVQNGYLPLDQIEKWLKQGSGQETAE